jgi:RES domain-containing protein
VPVTDSCKTVLFGPKDKDVMTPDIQELLNKINVQDYVLIIQITDDWVSYRYSPSPNTASKRAGRFNKDGEDAFYLADSEETAKHEIKFNYDKKKLYKVQSKYIKAFDAKRFAEQYSLSHPLTGAKEEGSYEFCQSISECLTETYGLSGVLYPSRQMALSNRSGQCLVLLPKTHQLVNGELRIFQEKK